jgi:hypothetical protein
MTGRSHITGEQHTSGKDSTIPKRKRKTTILCKENTIS